MPRLREVSRDEADPFVRQIYRMLFGERDPVREPDLRLEAQEALRLARETRASIYGIVGRDGGYTAKVADACVIVPTVNSRTVTPHTEAFQAVVWHLIVSHPALAANEMKWESLR